MILKIQSSDGQMTNSDSDPDIEIISCQGSLFAGLEKLENIERKRTVKALDKVIASYDNQQER